MLSCEYDLPSRAFTVLVFKVKCSDCKDTGIVFAKKYIGDRYSCSRAGHETFFKWVRIIPSPDFLNRKASFFVFFFFFFCLFCFFSFYLNGKRGFSSIAMNPKKAKRSDEKEESLLISYHSNEDRGDSDSDNKVPPLDLPPTRLRRPRSRYCAVL